MVQGLGTRSGGGCVREGGRGLGANGNEEDGHGTYAGFPSEFRMAAHAWSGADGLLAENCV